MKGADLRQSKQLGERVYASLPSADERFADFRAYLASMQTRGSGSPVPRIVGEWALVGFLVMTGRIGLGGQAPDLSALNISNPAELTQAQAAVAEAAEGFDFT